MLRVLSDDGAHCVTTTRSQIPYPLPFPLRSPSPNHRLFQCHFNAQNIRLQPLCEFTSFEPNQRVNTLRAFCFFNIHFIGFIIVVLIIRIVHWSPRNAIHSPLFIGWTLSFFIFIDGDSRNGICSLIAMSAFSKTQMFRAVFTEK